MRATTTQSCRSETTSLSGRSRARKTARRSGRLPRTDRSWMMKHILHRPLLASALVLGATTPALATQIFDFTNSKCTGTNCSSVQLGGTINANGAVAGPWVAEIFASQGQCLRLDVTQENVNTEIVAVSPSGLVFRNDDRSGADQRPLVGINGTERGFYTVQVSTSAGDAVESDFVLAFGRYNLNNPNCTPATQPAAAETAGPAAKGGSVGPGVAGGPSNGR